MPADRFASLRAHFARGRFAEAVAACDAALRAEPANPDLLHIKGLALFRLGRRAEARAALEQAARCAPDDPAIAGNFGRVLAADGRFAEAATQFRHALVRAPRSVADREDLGTALCCLERYEEGAAEYEAALKLDPARSATLLKLARVRLQQGHFETALDLATRAEGADARLAPRAAGLRGYASLRLGRPEEAEVEYSRAIAGGETGSDLRLGRGRARRRLGNPAGATEDFTAAAADPASAYDAALEQAAMADGAGDEASARQQIGRALVLRPGGFRARWIEAMMFPTLWRSEEEIATARESWNRKLAAIEVDLRLDSREAVLEAALAVQSVTNFRLHYQGADDRPEQERYGRILARIAAARHPEHAEPRRRAKGRRARVGFISAHLRQHSIWKTHGAWIADSRGDFAKHVYYAGHRTEAGFTDTVAAGADRFVQSNSTERLIAEIAADELDLLIYLDHGMSIELQLVAALPLAPVQANGLGHPVTSGLPAMTHALSSALMEPADGERFYSERLVRLAGTASCYNGARLTELIGSTPAPARSGDRIRYLCAQNLIKYLPRHDRVFAAIAAELPAAEFHFLGRDDREIVAFRARLAESFRKEGLEVERFCVFHGPLMPPDYIALNRASDLFLDAILWSGNNTTHEAVAAGLPVLTLPGPQMRGRHSLAVLTQMGMSETIANDLEGYIALAVRAGRDVAWRQHLVAETEARRARLFDDPSPIRDLERFIESALEAAERR